MSDEITTEARAGALRVVEGGDKRPEIVITHDLSTVTDEAAKHLARDGEIYQRGGELVHVVTPTPVSPGVARVPMIRALPLPTLRVRLSEIARWVKADAKGNYKRVAVPDSVTHAVHTRGQWERVRPLVGVVTAPTMRPDGSVLQAAGYDRKTGLLLWPSRAYVEVPEKPTRDDAIAAAEAVLDLVIDFPFATAEDKTAWLAGLLTLVGRHAINGPCPLFAIDANMRGSGKSRLCDVAVLLAHGTKAARSSISGVDEEMRKQITSILAEGSPAALLDNVRSGAKLGGPAFDALLTSDVWKERNLGKIQNLTLPARTVWWATGNNLRFAGDLTRRALRIRLESPLEDPEDRDDFKHGAGDKLLDHVERSRMVLVTQALLILRAHAVAGRPECGRAWGSFEGWSRVVVSAIRWLGLPDPLNVRATEDESADEDRLFAAAIAAMLGDVGRPLTARELVTELYPYGHYEGEGPPDVHDSYPAARDALEAATNARGTPTPLHVGHFLKRIQGRIVDGRAVVSQLDPHLKIQRWTTEKR